MKPLLMTALEGATQEWTGHLGQKSRTLKYVLEDNGATGNYCNYGTCKVYDFKAH